METPLTILYTYGLRGDLAVLPRLYSFLRQLKATYAEPVVQVCADEPAQPPGRVLLLDLGDSCAPNVWHCAVTHGRSTLVVLDGMGCDAVRVEDSRALAAKLGSSVRLALIDAETPLAIEDVLITADNQPGDRPHSLQIILTPAAATHLDGDQLHLAPPSGSQQVGVAQLTQIVGRWTLTAHEIHDLPRRTLPDPTIAASVEFVLSEALYAQKRKMS